MNTAIPLLVTLCCALASQATAAESCAPASPTEARVHSSFTVERGVVEDVLSSMEDGYRSLAYIVTWHGSRVLVSDPLAESNNQPGDGVEFLVSRNEIDGNGILAFTIAEHRTHRSAPRPGSSSVQASSATATGVVEEVLSAQDRGFRFIAYVVSSGDQRFAVSDTLALSHYAIGAQIDYLTLETATSSGPLLEREVQLSAAERAALSRPLCGIPSERETGVVDQALVTGADEYEYRAYVVAWHGSRVVIDDPTAATSYQPGDNVGFWWSRFQIRLPGLPSYQRFSFDRPPVTTVVNQPSDLQTSTAIDSAPVQAVLASDIDGYRSIAYLVNWHDTPVAVTDAFATTHFAVGDRIHFSVVRAATPTGKALSFLLFDFPRSRGAIPKPR